MSNSWAVGVVVLLAIAAGAYWIYAKDDMTNADMLRQGGAEISAQDITFGTSRGYYAAPTEPGNYPGVVMIHEWWGLNEGIKDTARDLAAQGYRVLAVDLFGKVAATPEEALAQVSALDQAKATQTMRDAAGYLRAQGAPKVASLGWCFGGKQSLELAKSGEPLAATVIYYGSNPPAEDTGLEVIDWPVLGIYGDQDQGIPVARIEQFRQALTQAGVQNDIHIYPGVGHAFANPSGANYAPEPTRDAWAKTLDFLARNLK